MKQAAPARAVGAAARRLFIAAGILLVLYGLNVAAGLAAVKLGAPVWRMGDVGEFVVVLCAMAFFVAGLLLDEDGSEGRAVNPTDGGEP